jgi:hypothetical protein
MMVQPADFEQRGTMQTLIPPPRPVERGVPISAWIAAVALLALAAAGAFASHREVQGLTTEIDDKNLERAGLLLARSIEQEGKELLTKVRVLSDDTRVRTTVMTPEFNEATVRDVLEDLRRASGTSMMAVMDVQGKVQALAGDSSLKGIDLGSSPLLAKALVEPVAKVWTFPGQVLIIGLAAVRSGGQVSALLLVGQQIGEATLKPIETAAGVAGAVVIGDKVVASSSSSPALAAAAQLASSVDEGRSRMIDVGGPHLMRVTATSESASAARVVWVLPTNQYGGRLLKLQILSWMPMLLVCLSLALALSLYRRRAPGDVA